MDGVLVLVVGPSGAGKDTLIAAAKAQLGSDPRFLFVRRVVTRTAMAELEDHDTIAHEDFETACASGAYALDWDAHGLRYGIPVAIDAALEAGRVVVFNGSRKIVPLAASKYPGSRVLLIDASPEVRARRLAGRGRESAADIEARLKREGAALPQSVPAIRIDNSGRLADGVQNFVSALEQLSR